MPKKQEKDKRQKNREEKDGTEGRVEKQESESLEMADELEQEMDDEYEGGHFEEGQADVILHAPEVSVDEIELDVDDLQAHVSLNTRLAQLLELRAGIDLSISDVKVSIRGVDTGVHLVVNLDKVEHILRNAFKAISENPEIFREALTGIGETAERSQEGAGGNGIGQQLKQKTEQLAEGAKDIGRSAKESARELGRSAKETVTGGSDQNGEQEEEDQESKSQRELLEQILEKLS